MKKFFLNIYVIKFKLEWVVVEIFYIKINNITNDNYKLKVDIDKLGEWRGQAIVIEKWSFTLIYLYTTMS